jgi:hypothetical protein
MYFSQGGKLNSRKYILVNAVLRAEYCLQSTSSYCAAVTYVIDFYYETVNLLEIELN